jgi:chemotaxis protein methyltransferase CheR
MPPEAADGGDEIRGFLEAIWTRYGYDLRGYAPASVRRRVAAAMAKLGVSAVADLEARCLETPEFFAEVLESLIVQVSGMFRDPKFFLAVRTRLAPLLRTYPRLDVWISGCATGEEVYSLAILLCEEGLYDRCQIYATDLSARAIERAKAGVYPGESAAPFAGRYLEAGGTSSFANYHTAAYDRIAMRESLRSNILFFQHDLVNDHSFGEMHVILCRNVLIYFGRELQQNVLRKLAASLRPGGFLGLGASEQVWGSAAGFFEDFAADQRVFRRGAQVVRP